MIRELATLGEQLGLGFALLPLAFAVLVTGLVFAAQSMARWFDDRNP